MEAGVDAGPAEGAGVGADPAGGVAGAFVAAGTLAGVGGVTGREERTGAGAGGVGGGAAAADRLVFSRSRASSAEITSAVAGSAPTPQVASSCVISWRARSLLDVEELIE